MAGRVFTSENSRTALNVNTNNVQAKKFPQYVAATLGELTIYFQLTHYCIYKLSFQIQCKRHSLTIRITPPLKM
jgi:hypothetical protein